MYKEDLRTFRHIVRDHEEKCLDDETMSMAIITFVDDLQYNFHRRNEIINILFDILAECNNAVMIAHFCVAEQKAIGLKKIEDHIIDLDDEFAASLVAAKVEGINIARLEQAFGDDLDTSIFDDESEDNPEDLADVDTIDTAVDYAIKSMNGTIVPQNNRMLN